MPKPQTETPDLPTSDAPLPKRGRKVGQPLNRDIMRIEIDRKKINLAIGYVTALVVGRDEPMTAAIAEEIGSRCSKLMKYLQLIQSGS